MDIISAFAEGKTIQNKTVTGVWCDLTESEGLPMGTFEEEPNNFRIKPDSKPESKTDANYRPFANVEECWQELLKHEPFGWVKDTEANEYLNVYCISNSASSIDLFGRMFKRCIFIDGSPYGIKVEE